MIDKWVLPICAVVLVAVSRVASLRNSRNDGCPLMVPPRRGSLVCLSGDEAVSCESGPSSVRFRCDEFFQLDGEGFLSCSGGAWSSSPPKCVPDCGRQNPALALIVNGVVATPGLFPWHVAIYNFVDGDYIFWCGGSLISEDSVITAAHCTWTETSPESLMFAFGKFRREFSFDDDRVQKRRARRIEILASYQDAAGNYNGDISLVFLDSPVVLTEFVRPVCVDWEQKFLEKHLVEGTLGVVLGWGLTENDTFSDLLRMVQVPVVSDEKCIAEQQRDFRKFVTYTSFCAGFKNGTGVCNGDSGGGLAFFESGRWYLQGLVSVSPRRSGTPYCDPHYYTVFTKVGAFSKWLKALQTSEADAEDKPRKNPKQTIKGWRVGVGRDFLDFIRKHFQSEELEVNGKKIIFPHSEKILEPFVQRKKP